ncbi:MAG TPA: alpha/beta fold hydrolase [Paucimonas sp.]|nr:alpha/beta fold hydrolase [Paucimonas sp.]
MKYLLAFALPILLALPPAVANTAATSIEQARSCHLPGHEAPLRCVKVGVPLDYRRPTSDKVDIHVAIAPAFRQPAKPDPLFILAGGPGQAGSDLLQILDRTFRKVRATRDIVFIDQRGTGRSGKLDCESTKSLDERPLAEQERIVAACLRDLARPYAAYNTENAARDIERVRSALGYGQINIWGGSYGTRLAQAYARLFPASVRALTLDGVASPEQIIFAWGSDVQSSLDALFKQCEQDRDCGGAFPALRDQFKAVLGRVNGGAVKLDFPHPRTAARIQMHLQPTAFLQTIRAALYTPDIRSRIPFLIDSADKGNWSPFIAQMHALADMALSTPSLGLMLSVVCAEDVPRLTPATIAQEERASFLAAIELKTIPGWCRYVDVPAARPAAPRTIEAPALLLSGALDPVTPPRRAEEAMKYMKRARHVIVRNGGHIVSTLGCAPRLLREFLDRPEQPLDAQCLNDIPPIGFQLGAAGPQP